MDGKTRKGQAAMEYLMTYGWAILVIVIVLAALSNFLPKSPEVCLMETGMACEGNAQIYVDGDGKLFVSLAVVNQLGKTVLTEGSEVICTNVASGITADSFGTNFEKIKNSEDIETDIAPGAIMHLKAVPCVKAEGEHKQITSTAGDSFKGTIAIMYNVDGDVDPTIKHIITGTIQGKVLSK